MKAVLHVVNPRQLLMQQSSHMVAFRVRAVVVEGPHCSWQGLQPVALVSDTLQVRRESQRVERGGEGDKRETVRGCQGT